MRVQTGVHHDTIGYGLGLMVTKHAPQVDGQMDGWTDTTWTILLPQLLAELKRGFEPCDPPFAPVHKKEPKAHSECQNPNGAPGIWMVNPLNNSAAIWIFGIHFGGTVLYITAYKLIAVTLPSQINAKNFCNLLITLLITIYQMFQISHIPPRQTHF
jgi:hypothetical protein